MGSPSHPVLGESRYACFACLLAYASAWEAMGTARMGGGGENQRFGCVRGRPSALQGGLSMVHFRL